MEHSLRDWGEGATSAAEEADQEVETLGEIDPHEV